MNRKLMMSHWIYLLSIYFFAVYFSVHHVHRARWTYAHRAFIGIGCQKRQHDPVAIHPNQMIINRSLLTQKFIKSTSVVGVFFGHSNRLASFFDRSDL